MKYQDENDAVIPFRAVYFLIAASNIENKVICRRKLKENCLICTSKCHNCNNLHTIIFFPNAVSLEHHKKILATSKRHQGRAGRPKERSGARGKYTQLREEAPISVIDLMSFSGQRRMPPRRSNRLDGRQRTHLYGQRLNKHTYRQPRGRTPRYTNNSTCIP